MPQLAGRESGKKSGPAREPRDHCFRVSRERGFLLRVCPEMAEHHLSKLQKQARAAAIISDPRGGHGPLTLPPRILCASTGHYPHPPGSLYSPPLPGSRGPGPTSPGEHMACLGLLQCHADLCHRRHTLHSTYD